VREFLLFALILAGLLVSCAKQPSDVSDRFANPVVLTDSQGNRYVVQHYLGNNYSVHILDK
jgi:hypothetical protein